MASTRISRLGLRFLSSISAWAFSGSGQPSASICTSGMSTHRSAWVRTSMAWQLPQWPQAPCSCRPPPPQARAPLGGEHPRERGGVSHSQARTSSSPRVLPRPDGPCSSQAWPRWASRLVRCAAIQGASAMAASLIAALPAWPPDGQPALAHNTLVSCCHTRWRSARRPGAQSAGAPPRRGRHSPGPRGGRTPPAGPRSGRARAQRPGARPPPRAARSNHSVRSGLRIKSGSGARPVCARRSKVDSTSRSKPRPAPW